MVLVLLWIVLSVIVGSAAHARGRSGVGWCVLSLLISPILAVLFLIAFPTKTMDDPFDGGPLRINGADNNVALIARRQRRSQQYLVVLIGSVLLIVIVSLWVTFIPHAGLQ